jgi:hypothetical protein
MWYIGKDFLYASLIVNTIGVFKFSRISYRGRRGGEVLHLRILAKSASLLMLDIRLQLCAGLGEGAVPAQIVRFIQGGK